MENICINPQSEEVELMATVVKLKNHFLALGFSSRTSFIEIMQSYFPEFNAYSEVGRLQSWWLYRVKDAELNTKIQTVLEKLRHE